jgi:hypothetical protein
MFFNNCKEREMRKSRMASQIRKASRTKVLPNAAELIVKLRHDPTIETFGGLFGQWTIEAKDQKGKIAFGMMSDKGSCIRWALEHGVKQSQIQTV